MFVIAKTLYILHLVSYKLFLIRCGKTNED